MGLKQMVNVAVRVRRLEKSRQMKVARQLEALTDPTFIDRVGISAEVGAIIGDLVTGTPVEPKPYVHNFNNSRVKVYSKRRDIIQ